MKLVNKKTREIGYFCFANWNDPVLIIMDKDGVQLAKYSSLTELNEEWEDYEEPKEYWYIYGNQVLKNKCDDVMEDRFKEIGNYFETKEEAEKAVEKLKAWKRLKDAELKIIKYETDGGIDKNDMFIGEIRLILSSSKRIDYKLLDLLFGGEE